MARKNRFKSFTLWKRKLTMESATGVSSYAKKHPPIRPQNDPSNQNPKKLPFKSSF